MFLSATDANFHQVYKNNTLVQYVSENCAESAKSVYKQRYTSLLYLSRLTPSAGGGCGVNQYQTELVVETLARQQHKFTAAQKGLSVFGTALQPHRSQEVDENNVPMVNGALTPNCRCSFYIKAQIKGAKFMFIAKWMNIAEKIHREKLLLIDYGAVWLSLIVPPYFYTNT